MAARTWAALALAAVIPLGTSLAEEGGATAAKESGLREARGSVQGIDREGNRVTVEPSKGSPLTLQVDKNTTIFIDGRTGSLEEIKAGAEVRASYESRQGANRAQWIEVNKKEKKPGQAHDRAPETPAPGSHAGPAQPAPSPAAAPQPGG